MGNVQFWNNKVLFTPAGKVAMDTKCCCGSGTVYALTPCATTCHACGDCCFSTDCEIDVTWSFSADLSQFSSGTFRAWCSGAMSGSKTLPFKSFSSGQMNWELVEGNYRYTVALACSTGRWQFSIHYYGGDYSGYILPNYQEGDCCGASGGGLIVGFMDMEWIEYVQGSGSVSITVENNHCCRDDGECREGPANCDGTCAGDARCPGGAPLYTRTNLADYEGHNLVGKVVEIAEDPDICYQVSVYGGTPDVVIEVTPIIRYDNCADCCADTGGTPI